MRIPIILLSILLLMAMLAFNPPAATGSIAVVAPLPPRATFTPAPPTATPDPDATTAPEPTDPPEAYPPPAYPAPSHHRHQTPREALSKLLEGLFGSR
jgi:hypothetical protein